MTGIAGFEFSYRLSGRRPTIKTFVVKNSETLTRGDMLNFEDGRADLGASGDLGFIGAAAESLDGVAETTAIRVVVDADAVYAVRDPRARLKGATLDLTGLSAAQGVSPSVNRDFVVDVDSAAGEETLVRINSASHYENAPPRRGADRLVGGDLNADRLVGGDLNAAIARAVVRYHAEQLGRGPTKARAFYRDEVVVVVLEDLLTTAERNLVAAGRGDAVEHTRRAFQETMRPYLRSTVERLTGCKVRAFMSTNHLEPDVAAELFVLDRPVPPEHGLPG